MPKPETKKTVEIRKTKRSLKCKFTDAELLQLGRDLADSTQQYGQLEADKKQVVKEFDFKLAELDAKIKSASGKVQTGSEYRNVDCNEALGDPSASQKTVTRLDTMEVVEVRDLTDDEKQRLLKFQEGQPADAAKLAELLPQTRNLDVATP